MHRVAVSKTTVLSFFLTLMFSFSLPADGLAAKRSVAKKPVEAVPQISVPVELTEYGSYTIHADQAGLDEDGTREAAHYVKGQLYFKGQPLLAALTVALGVSEPLEKMNLNDLKDLCLESQPKYASTFREATPPFLKIKPDGTISGTGERCEFFDLKAFIQVYTSEKALRTYQALSGEHRKFITAWRRGLQDAIVEESQRFYATFPELKSTNILEAIQTLDDRQLMSMVVAWETLYDISSMQRILAGSGSYVTSHLLGENLPMTSTPIPVMEGEDQLKQKLNVPHKVEGVGASNSAALVYRSSYDQPNSCVQTGQPHQPASERFKMPPLCVNFKDSSNKTVPVLQFGYASTAFYSPGSTSVHLATGGTADPVLILEIFYAMTNGRQYFHRPTDTWHNFSIKTFNVQSENGGFDTITRYGMDGFGEAYLLLEDPNNGEFYVISGRSRDADSAKTFFNEEEVAINGDAELFAQNLRDNTAMFWGKTYCAPDGDGGQTAAMINYQGQIHDMDNWEEFNPVYINYIREEFLRGKRRSNTACYGVSWASSDNGSLKGGNPLDECETAANVPQALDPGFQNSRQRFVRDFSQDLKSLDGPVAKERILQFATSTYSFPSHALAAAAAYGIRKHIEKAPALPESKFILGVAAIFNGHDGTHRGDELSLLMYILNDLYMKRATQPPVIHPDIRNFIEGTGEVNVQAALKAFTGEQASVFYDLARNAADIYLNNCDARGIKRYSDAVRVVYEGQTIIEPGTFNGPSPIGGARNTIATTFDPVQCSITATSISPLSHVYMDKIFKIYQFGTSASKYSFISPDVYNTSIQAWADVLKKHNKDGKGYAGENAHVDLCTFENNGDSGPGPRVLESFTVQVPPDLFNKPVREREPKR